ncbi:MAG: YqiA/YcfP family alpha/beta fold hydrolase [Bryobacteraceae bacterium]
MRTIYLHGFASGPGSSKARYFRERFAEIGIEMETPDLAEGNFEGLTISGQLLVVEKLAAGEPVRLLGSSMGGYLAALYAARHAETGSVVLMAPAFGFAKRWPLSLGEERMRKWRETGRMPVYHYGEERSCGVGYQLIEDGAQYEDYPAVTQPSLVFHGRQDEVVPSEFSVEFAERTPAAQLHILDSDHQLLNVLDFMWSQIKAL